MEKEYIYTAGLIDGEGTIGLVRSSSNKNRSPYVSVSSTSYELVKYLKTTFQGSISKHKTYQSHHKTSYSWKLNHDKAIEFIKLISPYMKEKEKLYRANLILSEYKSIT